MKKTELIVFMNELERRGVDLNKINKLKIADEYHERTKLFDNITIKCDKTECSYEKDGICDFALPCFKPTK